MLETIFDAIQCCARCYAQGYTRYYAQCCSQTHAQCYTQYLMLEAVLESMLDVILESTSVSILESATLKLYNLSIVKSQIRVRKQVGNSNGRQATCQRPIDQHQYSGRSYPAAASNTTLS